MIIRPETPEDIDSIRQVNRLAFGGDEEARLVDALREGGYVRMSLVADFGREVVGHILFSPLMITDGDVVHDALALAPMAVLPEWQGQGIGSQLVRSALERCRERGHRIVVVLGHPHFYTRFGFSAELARPLRSPYSGEAWMALELVPGALRHVSGEVAYAPPFQAL